jgi:hypothetical protein
LQGIQKKYTNKLKHHYLILAKKRDGLQQSVSIEEGKFFNLPNSNYYIHIYSRLLLGNGYEAASNS